MERLSTSSSANAAPEWQDGDCCFRCRAVFTVVSRKHHCRNCGNVFCARCSSQSIPIPKFGIDKSVRVCDDCYERLSGSAGADTNSIGSATGLGLSGPEKASTNGSTVTTTTKSSSTDPKTSAKASAPSETEMREEEELQLALALSLSEAISTPSSRSSRSRDNSTSISASNATISAVTGNSNTTKNSSCSVGTNATSKSTNSTMSAYPSSLDIEEQLNNLLNLNASSNSTSSNSSNQLNYSKSTNSNINSGPGSISNPVSQNLAQNLQNVAPLPTAAAIAHATAVAQAAIAHQTNSTNKTLPTEGVSSMSDVIVKTDATENLDSKSKTLSDEEEFTFINELQSNIEVFTNRMNSNKLRGRPIRNDTSIQALFLTLTEMHSRLLELIKKHDDERVKYEDLQDKISQIHDARAALNALREEHQEKIRQEAAEAERTRQSQLAHKLELMRQKKAELLQHQRDVAMQRLQQQETEMQLRQEKSKYSSDNSLTTVSNTAPVNWYAVSAATAPVVTSIGNESFGSIAPAREDQQAPTNSFPPQQPDANSYQTPATVITQQQQLDQHVPSVLQHTNGLNYQGVTAESSLSSESIALHQQSQALAQQLLSNVPPPTSIASNSMQIPNSYQHHQTIGQQQIPPLQNYAINQQVQFQQNQQANQVQVNQQQQPSRPVINEAMLISFDD